jgi:hypothetical protein
MAADNTEARQDSIAEHVRGLSEESAALVREELRLIREDLVAEARRLGAGGAMLGGAALLGLGAFGAVTAGLVSAVGRFVRPSTAGFTVALLYGAGAGALAKAGVEAVQRAAADAADTVGKDVQAAAEGARQDGG